MMSGPVGWKPITPTRKLKNKQLLLKVEFKVYYLSEGFKTCLESFIEPEPPFRQLGSYKR